MFFKLSIAKVVVRCKTSYTGLFSFLAIPLLMGDIMIEFMNMIDINGGANTFFVPHFSRDLFLSGNHDHNGDNDNSFNRGNRAEQQQQQQQWW